MHTFQFNLNDAIVWKGAKAQESVVHSVSGIKQVKKASERKTLCKQSWLNLLQSCIYRDE